MAGMQRYWMVPDELGAMSDGGTRVQSMNVEYGVDSEGNEEVTLFIFKCYNGMAVYKIGENVNGGVDEMMANKIVASRRYYNVMGQEITEPNGATIEVISYTDGSTSTIKVMR